jgi:hypothetical protein
MLHIIRYKIEGIDRWYLAKYGEIRLEKSKGSVVCIQQP